MTMMPPLLLLVLVLCSGSLKATLALHFTQSMYETSISENAPIGSTVLELSAIPTNPMDALTYGTWGFFPEFTINPSTGVITLSERLDYGRMPSYSGPLFFVSDGSQMLTAMVTIAVINENDNEPVCTPRVLYISLIENATLSNPLISLNCSDADDPPGTPLNYEILAGNEEGLFLLDTQGNVMTSAAPDHETRTLYDVEILVSDSGTPAPQLNTTVKLFVIIEPLNEYPPVFERDTFEFDISESAHIGTTLGRISVSDEDEGEDGVITISVAPMDDSGPFLLTPDTGTIVLSRSLDFETTDSYQFQVIASDSSLNTSFRLTSTATVIVHVLDSNDNAPAFTSMVYFVQVAEEPPSEIFQVVCTDDDTGLNQELAYSIVSGNDGDEFDISGTGMISSVTSLDFESTQLYQLRVRCNDGGIPPLSTETIVIIEITSLNEFFPNPTELETEAFVSEDTTPGTMIAQVVAHDRDSGPAGVLHYSLNYNSYCPEGLLHIDAATGMVFLITPLDFETGLRDVSCIVTISDSHPVPHYREVDLFVTITDVNDEPPLCSPLHIVNIPENTAPGSSVFTFSCTDLDSSSLEFFIMDDFTLPFQLSYNGAEARLTLQSELDTDSSNRSLYIIPVNVTDGSFTAEVTVYVLVSPANEYAPMFSETFFNCSISEMAAVGSAVCETGAHDHDSGEGGFVSYNIVSGDPDGVFGVNPLTGQIILLRSIDSGTTREYVLMLEASDHGTPPQSSLARVHITVTDGNNHAPVIAPLLFASVSENTPLGRQIAVINCTDSDSGSNAETVLELVSVTSLLPNGNEVTIESHLFILDSTSGSLILNGSIDAEVVTQYTLLVHCHDNGTPSLTSISTITIEVLSENEFHPSIIEDHYDTSIAESTPVGTTILQVSATDQDIGLDGTIRYALQAASHPLLAVDSHSGVMATVMPINCSMRTEYTFRIQAADGGSPSFSTPIYITLHIVNCSLGTLVPERTVYFASVTESAPLSTPILTVSCHGTRSDITDTVPRYSITSAGSNNFIVGPNSGVISVAAPLDFESATFHQIGLQCDDISDPIAVTNFYVYISILPENEHTPAFSESSYMVDVPENTTLGTNILSIHAHDLDRGDDGKILYSIQQNGQQSSQQFSIDPFSGDVYLTDFLDRETATQLSFRVFVQDCPANPENKRYASVDVTVHVLDSNDHRPQCNRTFYYVYVTPWTTVGTSLVNLSCSDADIGENSHLEYVLVEDTTEQLFHLQRNTGELTLAISSILNTSVIHHVPISVQDMGIPSLSTTVVVIVDVRDSIADTDSLQPEELVETEGIQNSVPMILQHLTLELWDQVAEDNFLHAIARSVTHYCALLPEECSLVSGCAEFYRRKRATESYVSFAELDVVILDDYPSEITSSEDTKSLEVHFYVILPPDASKAPQRATDFVVPRGTLSQIVQQDSTVIEAVVRDSVAPSQSQDSSVASSSGQWRGAAIAAFVVVTVLLSVSVAVALVVVVCKIKKRSSKMTKVVPLSTRPKKPKTSTNTSSGSTSNNRNKTNKSQGLRPLSDTTPLGANTPSDSCSVITLDNEHASMENNPGRESLSQRELSELNSSIRSGRGLVTYDLEESYDYRENWPWTPPRPLGRSTTLRPGHAGIKAWSTGRTIK